MLDIVVVSHNSQAVLEGCLNSFGDIDDATVTVVDSGSRSTSYLDSLARLDVRVLKVANVGYGTSANIGFADGEGEWLLLLNPDVRIDKASIARLMTDAARHAIDLIGPTLNDASGRLCDYPWRAMTPYWRRRQRWETLKSFGANCRETEVLNGSVLLMRRDALDAVGGFDTDFFLYGEEDDLVTRFRSAGYAVARDAAVTAVHFGEEGAEGVDIAWRVAQRMRGRHQYLAKHYSQVEAVLATARDLFRLVRHRGPKFAVLVANTARKDPRRSTSAVDQASAPAS